MSMPSVVVRTDITRVASGIHWYSGTVVGFDLETTGTDPTAARIVSAALVHVRSDGTTSAESRTWLVDPGVPIPSGATAVHGITTAHARAQGRRPAEAVGEILAGLAQAWAAGLPVVIFNAPYDLTLIDAEAARHNLPRLTARVGWRDAVIVDPLVIDRKVDRYRRGKRTLEAAALHYGVRAGAAHSADGDAVSACLVARAIAAGYPMVGAADPGLLRAAQVEWYREWAISFQAYRRSRGEPAFLVEKDWPLRAA